MSERMTDEAFGVACDDASGASVPRCWDAGLQLADEAARARAREAKLEAANAQQAERIRALEEALRGVLKHSAIRNHMEFLSRGVGTATDDGQAVLAAQALLGPRHG